MSTIRFVWDMLPPVGKAVAVAAPAAFAAGLVAALMLGGRS